MITITETSWLCEINCALACENADKIYEYLKKLGDYETRTFDVNSGGASSTINTCQKIGDIITLPKAKMAEAEKILTSNGELITVVTQPYPEADFRAVCRSYPNPARVNDPQAMPERIRLESLQMNTLIDVLHQGRNGAIDYGMGGGKTVLIAAVLAAHPTLRPAIITSAASGDSQQLASKMAIMTGEKVNLQGCTAGKLTTSQKKTLFVKKPKDATIICGSHALYSKFEKPATTADDVDLLKALETAQLVIIDEAHECCTIARITNLIRTNPKVCIAFTATWQKNWSKIDRLMADLLSTSRAPLGVVTHQQVQETGRVTEVEVLGWKLDREQWPIPPTRTRDWRGFNIMQREVEFHPARNIFTAHLCNHLMKVAEVEGRGCILVFSPTIGHCMRVAKELCKIRGIAYNDSEMEFDSIFVFNASLTNAEKTKRMIAMSEGRTKLVFSTETLSRGIDMNTIFDVVDIAGGSKLVSLVQKAGRAVRPQGDTKLARIHTIMEGELKEYEGRDKYLLKKCGESKIKTLEANFGVTAQITYPNQIPWKGFATVNLWNSTK